MTNFQKITNDLRAKDGPLEDPAELARYLCFVQLSDVRDPLEWLEYLNAEAEDSDH